MIKKSFGSSFEFEKQLVRLLRELVAQGMEPRFSSPGTGSAHVKGDGIATFTEAAHGESSGVGWVASKVVLSVRPEGFNYGDKRDESVLDGG